MKKKKRIVRTIISTMLLCCMLVGDLGSVFATSVDSSVVSEQSSEEEDNGQKVQTLSEPIEEPELGIQSEQPVSKLDTSVVEEPKVDASVETPEVKPEVVPEPTPEVEPEQPEAKPESEKPVEQPEVESEPEVKPEVKPEEKPSDSVPNEQPEVDVPTEEPAEPSVETTTPSETDNWSLDLVFYDSTVDGGKTPLKSIDWVAGNSDRLTKRLITLQINYKNNCTLRDYNPGDVKLKIPRLFFRSINSKDPDSETLLVVDYSIGANNGGTTGYDWSVESNSNSFTFKNDVTFDKNSNFEGSIQIVYSLKPYWCNCKEDGNYVEYCEHGKSKDLVCSLSTSSLSLNSNQVHFKYYSKYTHVWNKVTYAPHVEPKSLVYVDKIDVPIQDYYWVDFNSKVFKDKPYSGQTLQPNKLALKCCFPEGCVVYDFARNKLQSIDNYYSTTYDNFYRENFRTLFVVGFPKSVYNEEYNNTLISLDFELHGLYPISKEYEFLNQEQVSLDLREYTFSYSGGLYSHSLKLEGLNSNVLRYQDIVSDSVNSRCNVAYTRIRPCLYYSGVPFTAKIGVDLVYATNNSGSYSKVSENDYYISKIRLRDNYVTPNPVIDYSEYESELWVRYENESEYTFYTKITKDKVSSEDRPSWDLTKESKRVVGYYVLVKDSLETITYAPGCDIVFKKKDIPKFGKLQAFGYTQIYFKDSKGNLILQNEPTEESYVGSLTKEIAEYDLSTYGCYMQRAVDDIDWEYHDANLGFDLSTGISTGNVSVNNKKEVYNSSYSPNIEFKWLSKYNDIYNDTYSSDDMVYGFSMYSLLPKGVNLSSSLNQIKNSIKITSIDSYEIYSKDFEVINVEELLQIIKNNTIINSIDNWNNTGRTYISIKTDLSKKPFYISGVRSDDVFIEVNINVEIPYDSILSYGSNYRFNIFSEFTDQPMGSKSYFSNVKYTDYGFSDDKDVKDINMNGSIKDTLIAAREYITVLSTESTHQDVQTSVQTDKSNYSTGLVKASPESDYSYKLRARSGSNQVSNLVLVNNLEEGYGENEHWKGEFLGIDTSFAENRTYRVYKPSDPRADAEGYVQEKVKVKPYYSTSTTEGELYQTEEKVITDQSGQQITQKVWVVDEHGNFVKNPNWLEYSDSIDKNTVKSLAFEFLDAETGEQAILPENNLIYVEVKMKAPVEADGLTVDGKAKYAYNNCFTQWNALDSMGQAVDFITGINSNTVKVTVIDRVSVQINKVWEDEENKYNTRPDTVDFIMKKDGKEVDRQTLEKGKTTVTFSGLLVDELSTYTFEEVCPSGYTTEGVIYDKVTDTYTATNTLDPTSLVEVKGTKTWVGDLESERPESITVNLYRNDKKIDSKVVRASDGWSYDFGKFVKNDPDGNEYVYRVEEEPVEGYIASYASAENGLNIMFNSQCKTESDRYDYVEIYYNGSDGKTYKLGKWGGTALAGKVVGVPSKDFWLYWRTDSSSSNYYGFSIDSIESANVEATGTVATLPNYAVEEVSGSTYPDSAFDGHTHGNYGNSVNKVWHYTTGVSGFNIKNISNMDDISGTKHWEGDTPEMRPESITVNLLQNGTKIDSVTTDASKGWQYSFTAPKFDDTGRDYEYKVTEEPVEGYRTLYGYNKGSRITFSDLCKTESYYRDYVSIYYEYNGKLYCKKIGGNFAGRIVDIPSLEFYVYWRTDSSVCDYYGFSIDSVELIDDEDITIDSSDYIVSTLPTDVQKVTGDISEIQSSHNPYENNIKMLWKYTPDSVNGEFDIKNIYDNVKLNICKGLTNLDRKTFAVNIDGISFSLYENTLEKGYPEAFPGTSDEWVKVADLNKSSLGDVFSTVFSSDGLRSNKEYFLVENISDRVTVDGEVDVNIETIDKSCYVVRTAKGVVSELFLAVYGESSDGLYEYEWDGSDFYSKYGIERVGSPLHNFVKRITDRYPDSIYDSYYAMEAEDLSDGLWGIKSIVEEKVSVTKRIKASDINFNNGNPTFLFELRVFKPGRQVRDGLPWKYADLYDIKSIEFTKEYVEDNTDSNGYVSKTVYFDRLPGYSSKNLIREVNSSRYGISNEPIVTGADNYRYSVLNGEGYVKFTRGYPETSVIFTNNKYEGQYYSHNDVVVNEVNRNITKVYFPPE